MKLVSFLGTVLNSIESSNNAVDIIGRVTNHVVGNPPPIVKKMNDGDCLGLMLARLSKVQNTSDTYQTIHKFENSRNPSSNWLG
jgi:hypothetical protein